MIQRTYIYQAALLCALLSTSAHAMRKMQKLSKRLYGTISNHSNHDIVIHNLMQAIPAQVSTRYESTCKTPSVYPTHVIKKEFVRYAYLAKWLKHHKYETDSLDMFSPYVDDFWHTFLLFNQVYGEFCVKLPQKKMHEKIIDVLWHGKSFYSPLLYHHPHSVGRGCPAHCQHTKKEYFIKSYKDMYKISPSPKLWPGLYGCPCPFYGYTTDSLVPIQQSERSQPYAIKRYDFGHPPRAARTDSVRKGERGTSPRSGGDNTDVVTTIFVAQALQNNFDSSSSSSSSSKSSSSCSSCSSGSSSSGSSSDSGSSCSSCGGD